jgi:hypothetical protein
MNARFEPNSFNNGVVLNKMWNKVTGKKELEIKISS